MRDTRTRNGESEFHWASHTAAAINSMISLHGWGISTLTNIMFKKLPTLSGARVEFLNAWASPMHELDWLVKRQIPCMKPAEKSANIVDCAPVKCIELKINGIRWATESPCELNSLGRGKSRGKSNVGRGELESVISVKLISASNCPFAAISRCQYAKSRY